MVAVEGSGSGGRKVIDYKALAARVHEANKKWWTNIETGEPLILNLGERCMLVTSELSECLEAERKNLMDDHLPHRKGAEVEMADTVIRLLDMYGAEQGATFPPIKRSSVDDSLYIKYTSERANAMDSIIANTSDRGNRADWLFAINKVVTMFRTIPYRSDLILIIQMCELYCENFGYDLWGAFEDKMAYNAERADHKTENRIKDGGKKF